MSWFFQKIGPTKITIRLHNPRIAHTINKKLLSAQYYDILQSKSLKKWDLSGQGSNC